MTRQIPLRLFPALLIAALLLMAPMQGHAQGNPFAGAFNGSFFGMDVTLTLEDAGEGRLEGIVRVTDADGAVLGEFLAEALVEILLLVPEANFEDTAYVTTDGGMHFSLLGHMSHHQNANHDDGHSDADHNETEAVHDDGHTENDHVHEEG